MDKDETCHVSKRAMVIYFVLGLIAATLAWVFGSSHLPTIVLQKAAGIGPSTVAAIGAATVLLLACRLAGRQPASWARFMAGKAVQGAARAAFVMLGVCIVAAVCAAVTHSRPAVGVTALAAVISFAFFYLWWGIRAIYLAVASAHHKRHEAG